MHSILKVNGRQVYVWAAIDRKTGEVLAVRVSLGRSSLEAYLFLSTVRKKCVNRARLITDKGPWYIPGHAGCSGMNSKGLEKETA